MFFLILNNYLLTNKYNYIRISNLIITSSLRKVIIFNLILKIKNLKRSFLKEFKFINLSFKVQINNKAVQKDNLSFLRMIYKEYKLKIKIHYKLVKNMILLMIHNLVMKIKILMKFSKPYKAWNYFKNKIMMLPLCKNLVFIKNLLFLVNKWTQEDVSKWLQSI